MKAIRSCAELFVTIVLPAFAAFALMGCGDCEEIEAVRPFAQAFLRDLDDGVRTGTTARWTTLCRTLSNNATKLKDMCISYEEEFDGNGPHHVRARSLLRHGISFTDDIQSFCSRVRDARGNPEEASTLTYFGKKKLEELENTLLERGAVIWSADCQKKDAFARLTPSEPKRRAASVSTRGTPRPTTAATSSAITITPSHPGSAEAN